MRHVRRVNVTRISIHALRVEGDNCDTVCVINSAVFLSTPSGWRATQLRTKLYNYRRTISIHALRVEGDYVYLNDYTLYVVISIHALRVEGD